MSPSDPHTETITDGRLLLQSEPHAQAAAQSDPVTHAYADMLARAHTGQAVRAEDYLSGSDSLSVHADQLLDLVYAEYLAREEAGTPPDVAELSGRFPHIAERIRRQLELHHAIELSGESAATPVGAPPAPEWETIGRYRVITKLGEGGQGAVYRGFHPELARDVVIKVSRRETQPGKADALRAEARVLASLDHVGLARVYDFDTHDGKPFAVLEFVNGRTLDAVAAADPLSPQRAASIIADAADAVAYANERNVIHRDLKPQNIMLDSTGRVRVIDFGLARLFNPSDEAPADAGTISGTVAFMPPEQARGDTRAIGPRSDVFGLGAVLYFLLTGSPPYAGGTKLDQLKRAMDGNWDRATLAAAPVPPRLRDVCAKALATNPAERYPTAGAFAAAIRQAVAPVRPKPILAGIALLVVVGSGIGIWLGNRTPQAAAPAPTPAPAPPEPVKADPAPPQPKFDVRVWNDSTGKYRNVVYSLPLAAGEKLRYEADAPAERHLTLFAVEPTGEVRVLNTLTPQPEPGKISYPANVNETSPLTPPTGTVAVLLVGRTGSPVALDDVRAALGPTAWPVLPNRSLILVEREKVESFGGRGVGAPTKQNDPEGEVLHRLDTARTKLKASYDVLAGAAFSFK